MRRDTLGPLTVWATGGDDDSGGGDGPAVILCHGFGAPGDDLVPLAEVLRAPPRTRFFFPEGPMALPPPYQHGRAWWMIDLLRLESRLAAGKGDDLALVVPAGLDVARDALIATIDEIHRRAPAAKLVLGGFSQGAMLSTVAAAHSDVPLAGLLLMSGTSIAEPEWLPHMRKRRGLRVFQSHGSVDPLLAYPGAVRLRDRLVEAGCDVRFVPFPGGHEIPRSVVELAGEFLIETLASR